MEDLTFYENILEKHFLITAEDEKKEYLDFCLNEVKNNIIYCYDNNYPTKDVITELFKRAMVKYRQEK